jgi:hypothetical protein
MNSRYVIAGSTFALALIAAPLAQAETNVLSEDRLDIKLGNIIRVLDKKKAEHTVAAKTHASGAVSLHGTVSAISGDIILLSGKNAASYTVNAANAAVDGGTLADIAVGDTVKVKGTVNGSVIMATRIDDKHIEKRELQARLNHLRAGIVTSVSGGVLTLTNFGTGTTATVTTDASTTVKLNGKATTTAVITPGSVAIVLGTSGTTSPDAIVGGVIHIITRGFGWLKHFLTR